MALQVVQSNGRGDDRVHDAFWNFVHRAVFTFVKNGGVGHQVAHVAKEQQ